MYTLYDTNICIGVDASTPLEGKALLEEEEGHTKIFFGVENEDFNSNFSYQKNDYGLVLQV